MSYKRKTYRFPNAVEVEENHNGRYGAPGQKRKEKQSVTPEQMEKKNQRNREDRCRRKLRNNFRVSDYYVTLTYAKDARPSDMEAAKRDFDRMIRILRREYAASGMMLKWIRNIEVGSRGAWHIHMVLNRVPGTDIILGQAWTHGRVYFQMLHEKGEFRALATYLTKTPKTDPRLAASSYSSSRKLPIPEPEVKILKQRTWGKVRIPDGWFLDKESFWEGNDPVTGWPCRRYTLLRYHRRC